MGLARTLDTREILSFSVAFSPKKPDSKPKPAGFPSNWKIFSPDY